MSEHFLHGVEVIDINDGVRPIRTPASSVIGVVGTAPDADDTLFPLNQPVLIAGNRQQVAKLGLAGTLPMAMDGIFDQASAMVVVIRVAEDNDADVTLSNIIGGVDSETSQRLGLQALLDAESVVHVVPRLLIAPGFSHHLAVATELVNIAERLRAVAIIDGPNSSDEAAISYRHQLGSSRAYIVDPWVKVWHRTTSQETIQPSSSRVAGLIAKTDSELGFWHSPSNKIINGITGTARAIDFTLGDVNARANYLNSVDVTTIVHQQGYRLWGNRTTSSDPKWAFLSVRRTADLINDALLRSHLWAVDRNITKTYFQDVTEGVNAYLRHLTNIGAILGGECWADNELNSPSQLQQGNVYFDFDFTPPTPAEHISFRSHLVNDYFDIVLEN